MLPLMDQMVAVHHCFNPYSIGFYSLILLLFLSYKKISAGFNPYSIGFYSLIIGEYWSSDLGLGFNPYSIGFYSLMSYINSNRKHRWEFQSLFYWILFSYKNGGGSFNVSKSVSILILLDSILLSL